MMRRVYCSTGAEADKRALQATIDEQNLNQSLLENRTGKLESESSQASVVNKRLAKEIEVLTLTWPWVEGVVGRNLVQSWKRLKTRSNTTKVPLSNCNIRIYSN